jgi:Fe-S oxidoreductase
VIKQIVVRAEAYRLSAAYEIISDILLSRLIPYAEEITGDHQCGFWLSGPTTGHIFAFVKYWRKNVNAVKQCISFNKTYVTVRREVLYKLLVWYPHETGKANKNVSE